MIKGMLFDFDGTLIDSMKAWDHVAEELLSRHQVVSKEDLHSKFKTMSLQDAAQYLQEGYLPHMTSQAILQEIWRIVEQRYQQNFPLKLGVESCIQYLTKRHIKLGIVTASERHCTESALQHHGLRSAFSFVVTCDEVGMSKEQPDIFRYAMEKMKLHQDEVVVIEDALHALKSAKQAGLECWAVWEESQQADWEDICKISDQQFQTMKEMEDYVCTRL